MLRCEIELNSRRTRANRRIAFETLRCGRRRRRRRRTKHDLEDVRTGVRAGIEGKKCSKNVVRGAINENVLSIMWAHPGNICDELGNFHPLVHLSGGSYDRRFEEIPNFLSTCE